MQNAPDVTRFFHPVLAARKLKTKPVRVLLNGRAYALFRDAEGRAAALLDRCAHRFAPLSAGHVRPDGRLACPYHGWHYDAEGRGCNPSQTSLAKCDVPSLKVVERYGYLWLADREAPLSSLPEMEWEGYELGGSFDYLFEAPLHVSMANFTEDEHTPFVHTRLGWDEAHTGEIEFDARNFEDRTEVLYRAPQRPSPYIRVMGLKAGDIFRNEWVSRFDPVRTLYTISWSDRKTGRPRPVTLRFMIHMNPETEKTSRFHVFVFLKTESKLFRRMMPLVRKAALTLTWYEVDDDARFIPLVADTPFETKGMRLDKFDKPVIHNLKLLRSLYYGAPGQSEAVEMAVAPHERGLTLPAIQ
jgi:phenylpropionate dioxygenase-like ring-hydroxylating dioxygenase large terminal subunit